MNGKLSILLLLLYSVTWAQTTPNNALSQEFFNENDLIKNIKTLSSDAFEGRRTGTNGAKKAKDYIINQLSSFNVLPLDKNFEQPFTFTYQDRNYQGANILGCVKGTVTPEKYIVISAHYDHEGIKNGQIYNGADDDASGISALISFAEYFKKNPPQHSVIIAAFDAEELGLEGSKYYVNNSIVPLNNIVVNLNMDMISRSETNTLFAVGTRYDENLKALIANFKTIDKVKLLPGHDGDDNLENWTYSSDHASFHKKGIPFLYFGVDDHQDYHTPNDDFENIHPEFFKESVQVIISTFNNIDKLTF
jgi:Zn-dependent M28 family amino/carboxypeptidase